MSCYFSMQKTNFFNKVFTTKRAFILVTIAYVCGLILMIPPLSGNLGNLSYLSNLGICIVAINSYTSLSGALYHITLITGIETIILIIIIICYCRLGSTIRKQLFQTAPEIANTNKAGDRQVRIVNNDLFHVERDFALIKTLFLMLWLDLCVQLPCIIYSIFTLAGNTKWNLTVILIFMIVSYANTIVNPILIIRNYGLRSTRKVNRKRHRANRGPETAANRAVLRQHGLL
ncbi:uncharacterized protein TRIADDRAFT_56181 [Trichoplax adhaerens]|uniref:G-protein coupled receptors family 1 profile domain-containing protein n=1 Tax=Trichoplax adhaerens TaxID=10228 RepID=B3RXE5_TRIAD|nr:predicted protein [Trichoplax adhaerens]EDV24406.1 predicted protein [Trichoplax adhaerens]|eukprot:XP_002112296.1 predicted protein [Trichoplax adhaerens]